jgi:hypothetical protein
MKNLKEVSKMITTKTLAAEMGIAESSVYRHLKAEDIKTKDLNDPQLAEKIRVFKLKHAKSPVAVEVLSEVSKASDKELEALRDRNVKLQKRIDVLEAKEEKYRSAMEELRKFRELQEIRASDGRFWLLTCRQQELDIAALKGKLARHGLPEPEYSFKVNPQEAISNWKSGMKIEQMTTEERHESIARLNKYYDWCEQNGLQPY